MAKTPKKYFPLWPLGGHEILKDGCAARRQATTATADHKPAGAAGDQEPPPASKGNAV
ncbi:MAG: hypothetical protein R2911_39145 [Caldilineaceae bacterium]